MSRHPRLSATLDAILAKDWTNPEKRDAIMRAIDHWVHTREGMTVGVLTAYEAGIEHGKAERGDP